MAECLGQGCYDGIGNAIASLVIYLGLLIAAIVLALRRKWRGLGRYLVVVFVVAIGVPLASQYWMAWKVAAMLGREVQGNPPKISETVPLLVADEDDCYHGACEMVLAQAGDAGVFVLSIDSLTGLDLSQPLDLASLPLHRWIGPGNNGYDIRDLPLPPDEVQAAAARIDYLIITRRRWSGAQSAVEQALIHNRRLEGLRSSEEVTLAMAPLPKGGPLSFAELQFDLLDLQMNDRTLGLPLAIDYWESAHNSNPGAEVAARAICPSEDGQPALYCLEVFE